MNIYFDLLATINVSDVLASGFQVLKNTRISDWDIISMAIN